MVIPPSPPRTCTHIHPTTSRRCRMPVSNGETLCGAHNPNSIPCPKCTTPIPAHSLSRHLSKPLCPVVKRDLTVINSGYYNRNVNIVYPLTIPPTTTPSIDTLNTLLSLHRSPLPNPPPEPLPENSTIRSAWSNRRDHTLKMEYKHFVQIATLSALLLTPTPMTDTHIIEVAAGRGYTSLYIAHVLDLRNIPATVVTIDRAANRYKADRTLRAWVTQQTHSLQSFQRFRIDLAHLQLPSTNIQTIRLVAKHACGSALDLALKAATNFANVHKGDIKLVFASCCRHLCSFSAFGNGGDIWAHYGVSEQFFGQICKAALWGLDISHDEERADIGRRCRLFIDNVRVKWLISVGWDARVTTYTDARISPENFCIVATWRGLPPDQSEQERTAN